MIRSERTAPEGDPVFHFGPGSIVGASGAFKLAREVLSSEVEPPHQPRLQRFGSRVSYVIKAADPVTARVLQRWLALDAKKHARHIDEFVKLRPLDPLLCWLVVMRAVPVAEVLNALGEYGWGVVARQDAATPTPHRIRFDDVAGDIAEFRRRIDWALSECESAYGMQWLDRGDASILITACEAALEAGP